MAGRKEWQDGAWQGLNEEAAREQRIRGEE